MNFLRNLSTKVTPDYGFNPSINALVSELDQLSPRFELKRGEIEILHDPKEFYSLLKSKISKAKKRIFLSSLYIGKTQDELVDCISNALEVNPKLEVHILTDALRGTREAPSKSSASLLAQLMKRYNDQVDIRMYHTPHLNGISKLLVPKRFNEGFGLQHMKIYGFDDEVILSGANLSSDYFTNRQDRYYLFKSKDLSDYYYKVQHAVESLSYKLIHFEDKSQFRLVWPTSNPVNEPGKDIEKFLTGSTKILSQIFKLNEKKKFRDDVASDQRTFVYPISQFTPLLKPDISTEKPSILKILGYVNDKSVNWTFTTGYFNMLPEIKAKLLESSSKGVVITASPYANGFYKSKGISGCLPDAYLYLSKLFLQDVFKHGKKNDIILNEWKRGVVNTENGWSYHAKGLWATASNEEEPSLTVIGSSNYTRRAYSFDLETNAVVVTNDKELKSRMSNEVSNLLQYTNTLSLEDFKDEERKVNNLVIFATKLLGKRL
ncbi:unnamed protein product [Wickerhamomyces anomalus]